MDILLISDQPLTVVALRAVLRRQVPDAQVLDAAYMAEAMTLLNEHTDVRLVVLDLDTHGVRPVSTSALLRELWPQVPLVVLASNESDAGLLESVDLGVAAYLLKTAETQALHDAFGELLRHGGHDRAHVASSGVEAAAAEPAA